MTMRISSLLNATLERRKLLGGGAAVVGGLLGSLSASAQAPAPGGASPDEGSTRTPPAEDVAIDPAATSLPKFAAFAAAARFEDLPAAVVHESKRMLLDCMGCAIAGVHSDKGRWGIDYVRAFFPGPPQATVIGFGDRMPIPGAVFLNAELINALDHELTSFTSPGHVSPFVIPPILAAAEQRGASGKQFLAAFAVTHELADRIGGALGGSVLNGGKIIGCSSVVLGGAAGVGKLEGFSPGQLAEAMSMAALIAPMQSHQSLMRDTPPNSAKYLMAGWAAQAQSTAAYLIKAGHRGDVTILDQPWGFPLYGGFGTWNAAKALADLGSKWRFDKTTRYKAYPACGIMRGSFDCLKAVIDKNAIRPGEIERIRAYVEPSSIEPVFANRTIRNQIDAQFSVPYNLAVLAAGKTLAEWQTAETMHDPLVLRLMDKVSFGPHPGYEAAARKDPRAHLTKVEVTARGKLFSDERPYFKGSASPDPTTAMTDDDLIAKFADNAGRVLTAGRAREASKRLMDLENADGLGAVMAMMKA